MDLQVSLPTIESLMEAKVHLGHLAKHWHPAYKRFISGKANGFYLIDLDMTISKLKKACEFLVQAASKGDIIWVCRKKHLSNLVQNLAIQSKSHFVVSRWIGGLLTNFDVVRTSINKLIKLEQTFEKGVHDRTKYELMIMKREWKRLYRSFAGVKNLTKKPVALIVVDPVFEYSAVIEATKMSIPVIGIVDTDTDPNLVTYPIPANDDLISSVSVILEPLSKAILLGNKGKGVEHQLKDYSNIQVQILKTANDYQSSDDNPDFASEVVIISSDNVEENK
ncbi:MAG: 30S ribosomal protein S2 [Candidatus Dojkabacteria bacterium]|nr:30S ribosomal protein S2 [Candidatus Dojkabacteria bacterium]